MSPSRISRCVDITAIAPSSSSTKASAASASAFDQPHSSGRLPNSGSHPPASEPSHASCNPGVVEPGHVRVIDTEVVEQARDDAPGGGGRHGGGIGPVEDDRFGRPLVTRGPQEQLPSIVDRSTSSRLASGSAATSGRSTSPGARVVTSNALSDADDASHQRASTDRVSDASSAAASDIPAMSCAATAGLTAPVTRARSIAPPSSRRSAAAAPTVSSSPPMAAALVAAAASGVGQLRRSSCACRDPRRSHRWTSPSSPRRSMNPDGPAPSR